MVNYQEVISMKNPNPNPRRGRIRGLMKKGQAARIGNKSNQ